jgi:hypothetical protein
MNDLTTYAKQNNLNPRMAQRYREKLNIGQKIAGRWILKEDEWEKLYDYIKKNTTFS